MQINTRHALASSLIPNKSIVFHAALLLIFAAAAFGADGFTAPIYQINSGGGAVGTFAADYFANGGSIYSTTQPVDTSLVTAPAPPTVYQTERYGNFTYALTDLLPGQTYNVRLHFAEIRWRTAGARVFNVAINGQPALANFDIYAAAGASNRAIIRSFTVQADNNGAITVTYTSIVGEAMSSAIEVFGTSAQAFANPVQQINAGGGASGSFQADTAFVGGLSASTSANIDTSAVFNPAPETVYQSEHYGDFTYSVAGLSPNTSYAVRLHFSEWTVSATGSRVFSVIINGQPVLANFDIFAAAGRYKAIARRFAAISDSSGAIAIQLISAVNQATVNGIEILGSGPAPKTSSPLSINAGGPSSGSFATDTEYSGGNTLATARTIDISGASNPAPESVYQSERFGNFTYNLSGLDPTVSYLVRLHFAEFYWNAAGQRIFNVFINGQAILSRFDIAAAAGGPLKAVVREFSVRPDASGTIAIQFNSVVNQSSVSGIELVPGSSAPATYSISGTISPAAGGSGATVNLTGAATATVTTDSSGNYTFSGLANGAYTITPAHSGYQFVPGSQQVTVSGASVAAVNFSAISTQTYSLSGTIAPTDGGSGATLTLGGASAATVTSDSSGSYAFNGLANGAYTVTPAHPGYVFAPATQNVTVNGANVSGVDFAASPAPTYDISGTITPITGGAGASVAISGAATASVTADSMGNYNFTGLGNGSYTVAPYNAGYDFSPPNQNVTVNNANVSNVNFTATPQPTSGKWVMGYYTNWQENLYPINRIDFTALTHIALAHWLTQASGSLSSSGWDTAAPSITTPAHTAGVKVIMMLGGSDDVNYPSAASATNRQVLVNSILTKIRSLNLDGVDLDWENNINSGDLIALAQALRQAQPNLIITVPIDPSDQPASLAAGLAPYCDQLNMMTYGGGATGSGWVSWYFSAVGGDAPNHPSSVDRFVNNWLTAGVPAGKIGVGIGFYSRGWTAPVTGALQSTGGTTVPIGELPYGPSAANGGGVLSWFYNQPGANYAFDSGPAQQPSISIPAGLTPSGWTGAPITWVTYEDEASIAAKAAYVQSHNLGGSIIWTLEEGATDPVIGRNPLLDSVKLGFLNSGPAPTSLVASNSGTVAGAASISLTGLPTALGQVVVTWWNGNTSFDESVAHYGSYGRPSEYYIEASADGSSWTALTHITGNSYNGRQFAFDFTGKGYTQVRLRVVSIVGSNAGVVSLKLYSTPNNATDTYLLLGDSITSNCWAVAPNAFAKDVLANDIHAQRSNRWPVVTEGGIPGLLASSPLSTTAYGIPALRQWLKDFPSVKYVALSYGTNDANGNISPATYYANMKALVQEVIAAGKTPVIPTIVASPSTAVQANAPALNAQLVILEKQYPAIIKGPDLWTLFQGHSVNDGWFFDNLHPSLTTGCSALQNAWANALVLAVYPR